MVGRALLWQDVRQWLSGIILILAVLLIISFMGRNDDRD